jgi:hypothetical protein
LKDSYHKNLPQKLAALSKFLGENSWLAGENVIHYFFRKQNEPSDCIFIILDYDRRLYFLRNAGPALTF